MEARDQRIAVAGCCVALGALVPVALYQSGVIESLPDPPGSIFDSERITSSKLAHPLGVPDSFPGLASYGGTLALLLLAQRGPVFRRLLGAKLAGDGVLATFNGVRQVVHFRKLCSWCTATALATALVVYGGRKVLGETLREVKQLI